MPALDIPRLLKVLAMLGSSHDGEKLAAIARAQAMLAAAGKSWGDVVGAPSAGRSSSAIELAELRAAQMRLPRERAAFEEEKRTWQTQQRAKPETATEQAEKRQRRRASTEDDPRYGDCTDDDDPENAGLEQAQNWNNFAKRHPDLADWILRNRSWAFGQSLFDWVKMRGGLTAKQEDAVRRLIARRKAEEFTRYTEGI